MDRKYRLDIDLLKAIAIVSVVLYHFFVLYNTFNFNKITLFNSGFLGVDIFLAVSGYLITKGILRDLNSCNFSFKKFYLGRIMRIMPSLLIMILVTLVLCYFFVFPEVYHEAGTEAKNTLLFIGNYKLASSGGYFSLDAADRILLHCWYICITLQFYFLWPLFLSFLYKLSKEKLPYFVISLFFICFAMAIVMGRNGDGYLLTHDRLWELLSGAAVCLCEEKLIKLTGRFSKHICIFGFLLAIASIFLISEQSGQWYVSTSALSVLSACLIIACGSASCFNAFPLRYFALLGKSSYSIYLWHWPVFCIAMRLNNTVLFYTAEAVMSVLLIVFMFNYVEKKKFNSITVALLYFAVFSAACYVKKDNHENYMAQYMVELSNSDSLSYSDLSDEYKPSVVDSVEGFNVYKFGHQSEIPHIFVIGDSHADHYNHYLSSVNKFPLYFASLHGTIGYGSNFLSLDWNYGSEKKDNEIYYKILNNILSRLQNGDKVVLCNKWGLFYYVYLKQFNLKDSPENLNKFANFLAEDLQELFESHEELKFFIVGQGIMTSKAIVNCLKTNLSGSILEKFISFNSASCSQTIDTEANVSNIVNSRLIQLAEEYDNAFFIDRASFLSLGDGLYKTITPDGKPMYIDNNHYSQHGGDYVGEYIFNYVRNN